MPWLDQQRLHKVHADVNDTFLVAGVWYSRVKRPSQHSICHFGDRLEMAGSKDHVHRATSRTKSSLTLWQNTIIADMLHQAVKDDAG